MRDKEQIKKILIKHLSNAIDEVIDTLEEQEAIHWQKFHEQETRICKSMEEHYANAHQSLYPSL